MKTNLHIFTVLICALSVSLHAGPRASTNYSVPTESADAGGQRATSASYTHDGSAGGIASISTSNALQQIAKHGYLGQLFEVTGFVVGSPFSTLDEGTTMQMSAYWGLDDFTYLAIDPHTVTWGPVFGALASIGADGKATAGTVYENSLAGIGATCGGFITSRFFTVANVNTDDFGSYAADGLDDHWQFQHFGLDNPLAAPAVDPDGDGQANSFEFAAGLSPTDPASVFRLRVEIHPDQPGHMHLIFGPLVDGRTYDLQYRTNLSAGPWVPLTGAPFVDNAGTRTVTDLNTGNPSRFYRVQISRP